MKAARSSKEPSDSIGEDLWVSVFNARELYYQMMLMMFRGSGSGQDCALAQRAELRHPRAPRSSASNTTTSSSAKCYGNIRSPITTLRISRFGRRLVSIT